MRDELAREEADVGLIACHLMRVRKSRAAEEDRGGRRIKASDPHAERAGVCVRAEGMKSIRRKLTVWLLGGLAMLWVVAGAGIYLAVRNGLVKSMDAEGMIRR